jgi:hypothetical protein
MRTALMTNVVALPLLFGLLVSLETRSDEPSESWIERLIAVHRPVETLRCDVRRERTMAGKTTTRLSRVWYARGDRLRVEGASPLPTRVLADGTTIYKWIEGNPHGVRWVLSDAPANEQQQVRQVPGTVEEYLLRLRGSHETLLPGTPEYPIRVACHLEASDLRAILSLDPSNRLCHIEYVEETATQPRRMRIVFSNWTELRPGVFMPTLHRIHIEHDQRPPIDETVVISRVSVNPTFNPEEFDIARHAPNIRFVSPAEMERLLKEAPQ